MASRKWEIITGEYPPQQGGVSDYTHLVARGLAAAGDQVHVWAPQCRDAEGNGADWNIKVHRLPGHFGLHALFVLSRSLRPLPQGQLLVQYVPHAYGFKAMNLPFCIWLYAHRRRGTMVMFHEVVFPLGRGQPLTHNALGIVTRLMLLLVARSAARIFVATPLWERILRDRTETWAPVSWLPVPSNIPVIDDPYGVMAFKSRYAPDGGILLGHLGTYGSHTTQALGALLPAIFADHRGFVVLLMGTNSCDFKRLLARRYPELAPRVQATGTLPAEELSRAVSACDLMVQPYPDGASTRRGSLMAALAHGRAIVTNSGIATESLWAKSGALALAPQGEPDMMRSLIVNLLADEAQRACYSAKAVELYAQCFDLRHTIAALRST
ncbi:MAG: glycosyltransferase [Candidatus Binataceae bacterium]